MKDIATSSYDFKSIIDNAHVYVDKTGYIYDLVKDKVDARYFLSRPRRFGKSLLLSTLHTLLEGDAKYFRGLAIERLGYDFAESFPVIHIDLTSALAGTAAEVESMLKAMMVGCAESCGVEFSKESLVSPGLMLSDLIRKLALESQSGKVAVLVDEYDAPVTRLMDNPKEREAVRDKMHDFYVHLKVCDSKIRFLLITGVSKFAKMSVFSGLNNLMDISLDPRFAGMLGYVHEDIDSFLSEHVKSLAMKNGMTYEEMKHELLSWYDGYRFSPKSTVRVCNPVSLGMALKNSDIKNYWGATGNASIVYRALRDRILIPEDLDGLTMSESELDARLDGFRKVEPLLYQTGYLTISKVLDSGELVLSMPNKEVKDALQFGFLDFAFGGSAREILVNAECSKLRLESGDDIKRALNKILRSVFAAIPYEWACKDEAEAKRSFLIFWKLFGASIKTEVESSIGRADVIVECSTEIYIMEFKYGHTAQEALKQIDDRHYADAYIDDSRQIYKVGVNYNPAIRNIDDPVIVRYEGGDGMAASGPTGPYCGDEQSNRRYDTIVSAAAQSDGSANAPVL